MSITLAPATCSGEPSPVEAAEPAAQRARTKSKGKWSIHHVPDLPEDTALRINALRRSRVNVKRLDSNVKEIVWDYKIHAQQKSARNLKFTPMPPAELARIRLSNLSYLHTADTNLRIKNVLRAMSTHRILAHKHDLALMPEKIELALAFTRIASAAETHTYRAEWAGPEFAAFVKKYQHDVDAVVKSIQSYGFIDERLIDAEINAVALSLQDGAL